MKSLRTSSIQRSNHIFILLCLLGAFLAAGALSLLLGPESIPPGQVLHGLFDPADTVTRRILLYVRLPRALAGLLAGGALACAGVIVQVVLSNPLASPSTIGVNSGAGLAAAICCAAIPTNLTAVPLAAFAGAFLGTLLVVAIAQRTGASRLTLVLAGLAISGVFSAGVDVVLTFIPESLNGYSDFRIGGLDGVSVRQLMPAALLILPALLLALSLHNELDVLSLGQDQARALGLRAKGLRLLALGLSAALAGAAVSFGGLIGFVGLMVPHILRRLVGEESGPLLLACALGGGALLCGCDLLARLLFAPYELPVGILMSLLGGPFFLWLLFHQRGGRHGG